MTVPARKVSNLNPANAITASRFFTLPVFMWGIRHHSPQWAVLAILVCAFLDLFDGAVARALKCTTGFGELFDALADAICYGFFMIVVVAYGMAPWPPAVIAVVLGVVNTVMRASYAKRAGRATNYRSWAMEKCVAFAAYLGPFAVVGYEVTFFYWTFAIMMIVVMAHDTKRMLIDPISPLPPASNAEAA